VGVQCAEPIGGANEKAQRGDYSGFLQPSPGSLQRTVLEAPHLRMIAADLLALRRRPLLVPRRHEGLYL
jgi:hypothetical protein